MNLATYRGVDKITGENVYGCLVHLDFHNSVDYIDEYQIVLPNGHSYSVHPDSLAICTTIKDKNDIYIFASFEIDGKMTKGGDIVFSIAYEFDGIILFSGSQFIIKNKTNQWNIEEIPGYLKIIGTQYNNKEELQ